jgi:hypothetical protein
VEGGSPGNPNIVSPLSEHVFEGLALPCAAWAAPGAARVAAAIAAANKSARIARSVPLVFVVVVT